MRAAVYAGLVDDTTSSSEQVVFVREGEASLHYCLRGETNPKVSYRCGVGAVGV